MKKIFIFVLLLFTFVCCNPIGKGDCFVVTRVEDRGDKIYTYKYAVTIRTTYSNSWDCYVIYTNENYRVGDTLKLTLK